jgi:hypothetical protein
MSLTRVSTSSNSLQSLLPSILEELQASLGAVAQRRRDAVNAVHDGLAGFTVEDWACSAETTRRSWLAAAGDEAAFVYSKIDVKTMVVRGNVSTATATGPSGGWRRVVWCVVVIVARQARQPTDSTRGKTPGAVGRSVTACLMGVCLCFSAGGRCVPCLCCSSRKSPRS